MSIFERKKDHIDLCLNQDVASSERDFWNNVTLPHCACPDLSLEELSLTTKFLGHTYAAPLLISSMTGGTEEGTQINLRLAQLSAEKQIPMGVGSQRVALENADRVADFKQLKKSHPKSRLWANLGLVQLNYGVSIDDVLRICEMVDAEALVLHLNPLQEALQPSGDTNFKGLFKKFSQLRKKIVLPIVIKETGCGIDLPTAERFAELGADAIDVAGLGGTHWGYIETLRNKELHSLGHSFRNWGIPTPEALTKISIKLPELDLIASGGITNGVDATKALFLGAGLVGMAKAYLVAATNYQTLEEFHNSVEHAIRTALFCTNTASVQEIKEQLENFLDD